MRSLTASVPWPVLSRPFVVILALALVTMAGCSEDTAATTTSEDTLPGDPVRVVYEFESGSEGWAADVSDFSEDTRPDDFLVETGVTPPGIEEPSGYIHLAATNRSDDVFVYMMRLVGEELDLDPNTGYTLDFTVSAASDAPSDCVGIGGPPGEAVWLKVGASTEQPVPISEDGETRLSVDKGNQSQGGENADVAGVIANGIPCEEALEQDRPYAMVTWQETLDAVVSTDGQGEMWLFVGTDSGFEGRTDLYYDTIEVVFTPQG